LDDEVEKDNPKIEPPLVIVSNPKATPNVLASYPSTSKDFFLVFACLVCEPKLSKKKN